MPFKDAHSGKMTEPVTTGQIYWGAIPFVVIQCIMVALIIAFPAIVAYDKPDAGAQSGPQIDIQQMLKDDAKASERRSRHGAGPAQQEDDDALMKSLREAQVGRVRRAGSPSGARRAGVRRQ